MAMRWIRMDARLVNKLNWVDLLICKWAKRSTAVLKSLVIYRLDF